MGKPKTEGRMIRKEISESPDFCKLSPEAGVLFCMILPHLNAHGKLNGGAGYIKEIVCPKIKYITAEKIPTLMQEISDNTDIKWFLYDDRYWIHAVNFYKHQKLDLNKIGQDLLPTYSGLSQELVSHKEEDKVEVKEEAKGKSGLTPPVDNSPKKPEPKAEPVPEPPKEKNAFFEKRNKEFAETMAKIKTKYDYKQQQEIENWIKANYRGKHPDALIHTLNSIVHPKRPEKPDKITLYLDLVLKQENQNYNAADYDKQAAEFKKPGLFSMSDIFAGMKLHARAGG